ncbi:hypothetical protein QE152_g33187 [Popillia japonica]|uniref:Uncharacterized protein n=1 Tax=Popillia japonica TaxID=7064 RepID=A0AAW1IY58_POPJA
MASRKLLVHNVRAILPTITAPTVIYLPCKQLSEYFNTCVNMNMNTSRKNGAEVPPAGGAAIAAALSQNTGLFYSVLMLAGHRSTLTGNIATKWPVVEARVEFLNLDLSCLLNVLAAR